MIDEYFDRLVDRWCELAPAWMKPRVVLLSHSSFGWRFLLYFGTAWQKIAGAFGHISSEENMDLFMRETVERGDNGLARIRRFFEDGALAFFRLEDWGRSIRFTGALLLMMLASLGVAATGSRMMALTAASLCLLWLSVAVESHYAPVCGALRQRYLAATLLRTGSLSLMLVGYFDSYTAQGVPSNVVLQSAMIVTLSIHAILYLTMILLNTRQPFFLRALSGLTGVMPALTAASALALAASCLFRPWPQPLAGVAGALGAVLAFMGDQLITITHLGGIRLKYHSIWVCLLMTGGFTLMLLGAWTYAP